MEVRDPSFPHLLDASRAHTEFSLSSHTASMEHGNTPVASLESESAQNCQDPSGIPFRELTRTELESCSFENWYPVFESYTFQSTIIPLSSDFLRYLTDSSNGFFLPLDDGELRYRSQLSDSEESEGSSEDEPERKDRRARQRYAFPELNQLIRNAIRLHDGSVFPKLNWSAPQDAAFMLPSGDGLLRCRCPDDIYTLLKTSDCIAHDLSLAHKQLELPSDSPLSNPEPTPFVLVLREWFNLNPAHEFRCFVRDRRLTAISARSSTYFDYLHPLDVQAAITARITTFFQSVVAPNFGLSDFSFDVYLKNPTKTIPPNGNVRPNLKLLDFNPLSSYSNTYLFAFSEILSPTKDSNPTPELRLAANSGPQPSPFASSKLPLDILACSQGRGLEELTQQWTQLLAGGCVSEDEDEDSSRCQEKETSS